MTTAPSRRRIFSEMTEMLETQTATHDALARISDAAGRPMAAAFLSPCWPVHVAPNGIATYVGNIVESLQSLGHRPCVLSGQVGELGDGAPPVYHLSSIPDGRSLARRVLLGVARRIAPTRSVHASHSRAIAGAVRRAAAQRGVEILEMEESFGWAAQVRPRVPVPVVVRLHGPWFMIGPILGAKRDRAFEARVRRERSGVRSADGITAPSRNVLSQIREEYGLALENAVVIPNPGPAIPPDQRWRLANSDRQTILFVGRFDLVKGGDTIIDAFAQVARTHPQARLRFVGPDRGLTDDRGRTWTLPEYLAERAPEAMAAGRVECLGHQPNSSLPALRRRAAVIVAPSRYETFGLTVLEAAAMGVPLVATRVGGIPEIIEDGRTGLLVPPGDPQALALAIGRLLDDPDLAARFGQRAGEVAARDFHPDQIARRTMEYHQLIVDRHRRGVDAWSRL